MRTHMTLTDGSARTVPSAPGEPRRFTRRLWIGALGATVAFSLASIGPAYACDDDTEVSAAEVENALSGASSPRVEPAIDGSTTSTAAAVVDGEGGSVSVPQHPSDGVEVTVGTTPLAIGLPEAGEASTAITSGSGAIIYPSGNGAANAVVPLNDGVQMLTTITSADAPSSFSYQIDIPQDGSVTLNHDGTAVISDAEGKPLITTSAPWAVDANGPPYRPTTRSRAPPSSKWSTMPPATSATRSWPTPHIGGAGRNGGPHPASTSPSLRQV